MRDSNSNGALFPLPDTVTGFVLEAGVGNNVAKTGCSLLLAHSNGLPSLKIDLTKPIVRVGIVLIIAPAMGVGIHPSKAQDVNIQV